MMEAKTGDKIRALGQTIVIYRILYQEYSDLPGWGWDIEFLDPTGGYHHWKQSEDGGQLLRSPKRLVDWYGTDCTDLFRKYGYRV